MRSAERGAGRRAVVALLAVLAAATAAACGPFFPNMMLVSGDGPVLTAPVSRFNDEMARWLRRLNIETPAFPRLESTNSQTEATRLADLTDLRGALRARGAGTSEVERVVAAYSQARMEVARHTATHEQAANPNADEKPSDTATHTLPDVRMPSGLPEEFADYFRGALAWHRGETNAARAAWRMLLERPSHERRFKSVWAAFMLAKSWEAEDPIQAVNYYGQVRSMARERFADSLGLAAASIGWEGRARLKNGEFGPAIELYLQQLALGDDTAYASLHMAAHQALESETDVLESLATQPHGRAVINALLTSTAPSLWSENGAGRNTRRWLRAAERAQVTDMESAEQLALVNYQMGSFGTALRWAKRSTNSPVSQWVQAKLLLRAGKVNEGASVIGRLAHMFPLTEPTNAANMVLRESLYIPSADGDGRVHCITPGRQALGELGVLRLHRREYAQALDALLRAGFWVDAAYVAERVLTTDEFKDYVDRNWPEVMKDMDEDNDLPEEMKPGVQSQKIRYILARRLARDARVAEARSYFPPEWLEKYDLFIQCLTAAYDTQAPREQRVTNYYTAAFLIRSNGMEMIGTEVQPDFTCWAGNHVDGPAWEDRATNALTSVTGATHDEIERALAHGAVPDERWHYRAFAPGLRAEAKILEFELRLEEVMKLPRNTDETAMAFYKLGKNAPALDLADIAYKQLVRRCRKTELGDAADRQRWFPSFDENGKPVVTRKPKGENKTPEAAAPPPAGN